ncbi:hypothetical protein A3D78_03625 [Candidatus Gottesmanbacteria bacterium RIFCSPHIGHO2_02_FULL_39_14]|uniref:Addiction module toxin RelE n=2 Tax=Candidatus Gottesmaniibacteriota TaxID=1752720 RepID=A0A1F5ZYB2_9BACT|nr:MAG: hypothetical protein A3D78_03625 [Candidatus Gottesmanbacteria bacterium RIFCSPHIGHO2_02_FULL_39_14]OGG32376.1 MAG: hypothetical protein A3I51_00835 [Candidatus Gottesmanbacteria bacterium RIFCSPLOWO2_02_FULL_38_8]
MVTEWSIETYETSGGSKPVDEFIQKQQPKTIAKIIHHNILLRQYGNRLGMPHAKNLGSGLFELRIRGKEEIRIFYCFKQKTVFLLHAFKKQTRKTPQRELEVALKRIEELLT